jgi:hypothetical protein
MYHGLSSIIGNEFVQSMDWSAFWANLLPRLINVWDKWMIGIDPIVEYLFLGGFLLSLFFYRKVSNQKLPLQIFLALALAILLMLQRVTPTPRIWLYLEAFYLMFAAAGLVWLTDWPVRRIIEPTLAERFLSFAILLVFIGISTNALIARQQNAVETDDHSPEEYAADYLADHLQPEDTLVATGPVDIETLIIYSMKFFAFLQAGYPCLIRMHWSCAKIVTNAKYQILHWINRWI